MAFRSLQNGSFWCPKILMSSTKIWQSLLKPTVYYKMVPYDPIFTIEWQHYRGDNPSHSMEEMATGIRQALFSCGFGPCSSFRAMVFCCRELLFWEAVLPASAAAAAATSSASSRRQQKLFFQDFRRHVRHFFRVVLDLARPSEPQCFACSCQHYQQQQDHGKRMLKQQQGSRRQAAVSKRVGSRQEIHSLPAGSSEQALLGCHCNALFRPLVPWCFPVRQVIFSKLFYGSSRRQQKLSKNVVFPRFQK